MYLERWIRRRDLRRPIFSTYFLPYFMATPTSFPSNFKHISWIIFFYHKMALHRNLDIPKMKKMLYLTYV